MSSQPHQAPAAFRLGRGALALGLALTAPAEAAFTFTWNPGAIVSGSAAFTADTLLATEVSHIRFTSATDWTEVGYAKITGATLGGSTVTTSGLGTDYSLYFSFQGTGKQGASLSDPGSFLSMTMDLFGVAGAATFGIDVNNDAYVNTGTATPVKLAGTTFIQGTTALAGSAMSATLLGDFTPAAGQESFFAALPSPALLYGDFRHVVGGDVVPELDAGDNLIGFVIQGGDDKLSFVPTPAPLVLLAGALPALASRHRRRAPTR